jgi:signal transduction histidine kinase
MDEATLRRVCEPFFSTRSVSRGLGMAAARGVVTRHNGFLTLSSSPGEGTEVEVLLPTAELSLQREEGT